MQGNPVLAASAFR